MSVVFVLPVSFSNILWLSSRNRCRRSEPWALGGCIWGLSPYNGYSGALRVTPADPRHRGGAVPEGGLQRAIGTSGTSASGRGLPTSLASGH